MSPFMQRSALLRIMQEIEEKKETMLWDAELPRQRKLVWTQLPFFWQNKKLIRKFFQEYKGEIVTAEYYPDSWLARGWFSLVGVHFDPKVYRNKIAKMVYTSLHGWGKKN